MDGWITIGTELSTDKFDRQIIELEKKMKKEENKKIIIGSALTTQEEELDRAIKKTDELADAYQRLKKVQKDVSGGKATPSQFMELQGLTSKYGSLENLGLIFDKSLAKQDALQQKVEQTKFQYNEINDKISEYKNKINNINLQKQQAELKNIKDGYTNISNTLQGIGHKVGKWALAVFSVRSAYMLIRQTVNTLAQENQQLANQIGNIKLALTNILAPVIQFIVNLVERLVGVIGYILKALFNIDIFAKSTASSLSSSSGSIKAMKKDLAGFDEANVLGGNLAGGGVGGGLAGNLKDLEKIGEETWRKLKKWFFGTEDLSWEGITTALKKSFDEYIFYLKEAFRPLGEWIDKNIWKPLEKDFKGAIEIMRPYLEPLKDDFINLVEEIKPYWTSFADFMKNNIIRPLSDEFHKNFDPIGKDIYNALVPFLNDCIEVINQMFGVFGVHLDKLEYDTYQTGQEVEDNLTTPMENVEDNINELNSQEININTDTTEINQTSNELDDMLNTLWEIVKTPWNIVTTFTTNLGNSVNNLFSGLRQKLGSVGINLPFMATGGIVNMPNKGTLVGGAMAGESGKEGIVPLTDQQAMAELGREIGRNVLVNLTNVTTMNGRVIGRELKNIQSEQNFAYNT